MYNYGWGDIDNNGYLDETDLELITESICSYCFGDGSLACKAADVNGDGDIDMKDLIRIKKILGIIPSENVGGAYTTMENIPDYLEKFSN